MWQENNDPEIPKDYQKLKQQNIKLRNELKQINDFLTKQVEKKQEQKNQPMQINTDLKDETLKSELMNAQKQIKIYLKQIQILQNRQEIVSLDKYLTQLQSQVKQYSEHIKELEQERRLLININGKYEKKLIELTEDDIIKHRIEQLEQENHNLKQRILTQAKTERSKSVQATKVEVKPLILTQKQQEILKEKDAYIQQLLLKLQDQEKHIKALMNLKGQYDKQIGSMTHRIKSLEQQLGSMSQQLQDKNAEIHKRNHMLPNLSMRNARYQNKLNLSVDHASLDIPKFSKDQKTLVLTQPQQTQHTQQYSSQTQRSTEKIKEIKVNRIEMAGIENAEQMFLDCPGYQKLHNLKLWWDQDKLVGIQAFYIKQTSIISGNVHCCKELGKLSTQQVELNQSDFVKQIGIGFKDQKISNNILMQGFVQITTKQNCVLKFGLETLDPETLKISDNEVFGCISGTFTESCISSIGFQVLDIKNVVEQ